MPHGNNDTELAGTARAFIKSVGDLQLHDAFVEHGLEDDFEDALDERITDFEDSQDTQSAAGQTSATLENPKNWLFNEFFKVAATTKPEWIVIFPRKRGLDCW